MRLKTDFYKTICKKQNPLKKKWFFGGMIAKDDFMSFTDVKLFE
jgi:hypothetical protein